MNDHAALSNAFRLRPETTPRIETRHRRIQTDLPAPATCELVRESSDLFAEVNCYQPPILWDRAEGYQVFDAAGNAWIDFSSTAVMTNSGHGHPAVREAIRVHSEDGLLAQFSFASEVRVSLARELLKLAPPSCEKVYFWTVGSEAIECALRLTREYGARKRPGKLQILTHSGDYHGWTHGAHQLSGVSAQKEWLPGSDSGIHHLPFPRTQSGPPPTDAEWRAFFDDNIAQLEARGVRPEDVAAVFIETLQGWGALDLPKAYVQRLREWADAHEVLLVFDEVQTGFGRTGRWFGHEHYDVRADLLCIGKGLTSSLPLAAVLGPAAVLDAVPPGAITTTHAAHPLSCAAALANLKVLREERLVEMSDSSGRIARREMGKLRERFPGLISEVRGLGLLNAFHVKNGSTGEPDRRLACDWTWAAVKHGVMVFQTNQTTLKVCPPLVIPEDALIEGIAALGDALESLGHR